MPAPSPSVRPSAWEWARAALLSANLVWTTACLGGILPGTRLVTAVLTAALLAVHLSDPALGARAHRAGLLLVPFLAYAAANAAWVTPFRWLGWPDWLNWAQAVAVFWVVLNGVRSVACRRFLCITLAALGLGSAVLAGYQHFADPHWLALGRTQADQFVGRSSGPFGIPNSLGVLMALLIPPGGATLFGRARSPALRVVAAVVLAALAAGFVLAVSRGAWLALAAAFTLRPLLSPGRSLLRRLSGAVAAVAVAAAAATLLYFSFPLMRVRVNQLVADVGERTRPILWRGAWKIHEDHPVLGGGAGSFNVLFEKYRPLGFRDEPVYAHCDYLNTLSDYGVLGFALLFGAAAVIAWRCAGARGLGGAAFTGLLAFALHLLVDFHLKIPALAMIVATIAGLVTSEAWPDHSGSAPGAVSRAAAICVAAVFLGLTFVWAVPKYRAEETRRAARLKIDKMGASGVDASGERDRIAAIRGELALAVAIDPANAQAWSDRAYADSLWALVNPDQTVELGAEVEREASRALELCPAVAEFWIRKGTGFDMQRRWVEGGDCLVRALQQAPNRADVWYYQAYHLSLASTETGPALAAADICLRLDPGFLLAQVLRQRLGGSPQ